MGFMKKKQKGRGSSARESGAGKARKPELSNKVYRQELARLHIELAKLQEWIKYKRLKVVVVFEGRDTAGKGGMIKRITESLSPRICRVVALGVPTERGEDAVVLSALRGASSCSGRNGPV